MREDAFPGIRNGTAPSQPKENMEYQRTYRAKTHLIRSVFALSLAFGGMGLVQAEDLPLSVMDSRFAQRSPSTESLSFPIEDSTFFLSPGDRLRVRWWGVGSGTEDVTVNTRWELVIPDVAKFSVRAMSFGNIRDSLETLLLKRSKASLVDVQIVAIARPSIQVAGLVPVPGNYDIEPGTRLSKVLEKAGLSPGKLIKEIASGTPPRMGDRYRLPSVRRIGVIRSRAHDTLWCDLARAYNGGEISHDPILFAGDQVWVRAQSEMVALTGDAPLAGYIEYIPGESLGDILKSAGIPTATSAVIRDASGAEKTLSYGDTLPKSLTLISLPPISYPQPVRIVWVSGFVRHPGGYPLTEGMTVTDLVHLAGGSNASDDSSVAIGVKRGWNWMFINPKIGLAEETQYPEVRLALHEYENRVGRQYASLTQKLQPGDSVIVSQAEQVVWVGGQVKNPGFVTWKKGATLDDYVDAVGGYSSRPWPSRSVIYNIYTQRKTAIGEPISQGSAIIVPEKRYIYPDQWFSLMATGASLLIAAWSVYLQAAQ